MDKIRTKATGLPDGWVKEVVVRKNGASAGKSDVYYYSPEGRKCRSKPQMMQYLPDNFDIDNFDFRGSSNTDRLLKKRNKRKNGFNFGKEFNIPGSSSKPTRQTKKSRENIPISVLNTVNVENDRRKREVKRVPRMEMESKRRRAEALTQRHSKPKQLFWQSRLQQLNARNKLTEKPTEPAKLDNVMKNLLPGSNNQSLLNSLWYSLFLNNKVSGQHASLNALRKHPTALVNPDQPFTAPFNVNEELLREQERRVEMARRKLCEAQELLKALQDEDMEFDDLDDL